MLSPPHGSDDASNIPFDDDAVFRALASRTRRDILDRLRDRPLTTGAICSLLPGLDRCTVMQHLRVLEDAQLVIVHRLGRERWNHLSALPIKHIHDRWIGTYAAGAVALLERLRADLETGAPTGPGSPRQPAR